MKRTIFRTLLYVAMAGLIGATAHAQTVLFNNGAANSNSAVGRFADAGNGPSGHTMAGNIFSPATSGQANEIHFFGLYDSSVVPTDNFTLSLYSATANSVGSLISTSTISGLTRSDVGPDGSLGGTLYRFDGTIDNSFALSSGTDYYLGISDATTPFANFLLPNSQNPVTTVEFSYSPSGGFESLGSGLAFELTDVEPTPEPSAGMMGLGAGGIFLALRLARRSFRA